MKVKDIIRGRSVWLPSGLRNSQWHPRVSVILPTYRRAKNGFFRAAVESVLNQTYKDLELIIVDDCSTDGTKDIIEGIMTADSRVSCIRHTSNIGLPAISVYEAYAKALGDYIAFCFDDNEWYDDAIELTLKVMDERNAKASYGIAESIDEEGSVESLGVPGTNIDNLLIYNFIGNGAVVLHRDIIEEVGLYDPHLAITRLCDWDLWRRIHRKCVFLSTGVRFAREKGFTQKDSLGNSYLLDGWTAFEHMASERDELLRPLAFADYDVSCRGTGKSWEYIDYVEKCESFFASKDWAKESSSGVEGIVGTDIKRVAVVCGAVDASVSFVFGRVSNRDGFVFRCFDIVDCPVSELGKADAIIIVRDLYTLECIPVKARMLGIPCYYYIDDNFISLSRNYQDVVEYRRIAERTNASYFRYFAGVICTSKALEEFFLKENIHANVLYVTPLICGAFGEETLNPIVGKLKVAFMGGPFRYQAFRDEVVPALRELSDTAGIEVMCPKDLVSESWASAGDAFRVTEIERTISLEAVLKEYEAFKPNVVVHPANYKLTNNAYQSQNALINAVQLGAVLVTSKCAPYSQQRKDCECYLTADQNSQSWFFYLDRVRSDGRFASYVYRNASTYCIEHFSEDASLAELKAEIQQTKPIETMFEVDPLDIWSLRYKNHSVPDFPLANRRVNRSSQNPKSYSVVCTVDACDAVGILFHKDNSLLDGIIAVSVYHDGALLAAAEQPMNAIDDDGWSYFPARLGKGRKGQMLVIELGFIYGNQSDGLGVIEDNTKRSFTHKVANRFGIFPQVTDLLPVDFVDYESDNGLKA